MAGGPPLARPVGVHRIYCVISGGAAGRHAPATRWRCLLHLTFPEGTPPLAGVWRVAPPPETEKSGFTLEAVKEAATIRERNPEEKRLPDARSGKRARRPTNGVDGFRGESCGNF
jgi:hypothetical protein